MRFLVPRVLIALLIALTAAAGPLPAQQQLDRRDRWEPAIVLNTGGRTGTCDVLKFTPDGKELLAAGDDKCVTVYPAGEKKLDNDHVRVLRWPVWREQRGSIYAMALSPDGNRVVVGGLGMRNSDVAVLNRTGKPEDALTHLETIRRDKDDKSNYFAIMSLAFSPSGERVAVGTASGSMWVWKPGEQPVLLGFHPPKQESDFNRVRAILFDGEDRLFSVAESGVVVRWWLQNGAWQHQDVLDLKPTYPLRAAVFHHGRGLVAAGEEGPGLRIGELATGKMATINLDGDEFPRSLALSADGLQLAAGVGKLRKTIKFPLESEAEFSIRLYDLKLDLPKETGRLPHRGIAEALAWNGDRLAVAGGDNHEVTLWDLKRQQKSAARGEGSGLWGVALSEDGRYFAFTDSRDANADHPNKRGTGKYRYFDQRRRHIDTVMPEGFKPVPNLDSCDGWSVKPDPTRPSQWLVVDPSNVEYPLPWDRDEDGRPSCYTFLAPVSGKPVRLAVGHYWGFSLFELAPGSIRRVRLYTGHGGQVTAFARSKDDKWILTASDDQTVAAWSLEDWPTKSRYGATFAAGPTSVKVQQVDAGSPAWEMGLAPGDEITLLSVIVREGRRDKPTDVFVENQTGTPAQAKALLQNAQLGKETYVTVRRGNKVFDTFSTIRTRPMWRFLPSRDREWVIWMWLGGFYDTSTHGDSLAGWLLSDSEKGKPPRFYPLERFRDAFQREDVIDELRDTRDVGKALKVALGLNPVPINLGLNEPPAVEISLPTDTIKEPVKARLRATARGDNPDFQPQRVELWINDYRARLWDDPPRPFDVEFVIDPKILRSGTNKLTLQSFNQLGGRSEVSRTVKNPAAEPPRKLLVLGVGVDKYGASVGADGKRGVFKDLTGAVNDVKMETEEWAKQKDKLYKATDVAMRANEQVSRDRILAELDRLAKEAQPDDRLLIFLSGHGDFRETPSEKPKKPISRFYFCCPNYDRNRPEQTSIDHETLYTKLAAIKCRKVVFLDACHSGEAASTWESNPVRKLTPGGQGPTILAACDRSEYAYEHPQKHNGLFTLAVLKALGDGFKDADRNGDGVLDPNELIEAVRGYMPALLRESNKPEDAQNPQCFPLKPEPFPLYGR